MCRGTKVKRACAAATALMVGVLLVSAGCATVVETRDVSVTPAAADDPQGIADVIPIFGDSEVRYDDEIGFEEYYVVVSEEEVVTVMGTIRRLWCRPEEGSSPLEIMLFYQEAIEDLGGTILFQTRDAQSIRVEGEDLTSYFSKERLDRGMSTYVWDFYTFPGAMSEYLSAVVPFGDSESYVVIAAGRDARKMQLRASRFEIVTVDM